MDSPFPSAASPEPNDHPRAGESAASGASSPDPCRGTSSTPTRGPVVPPVPAVVQVRPWVDPLAVRPGHDPRSAYVERYWLPILGPSAIALLRLLAHGFDSSPEGYPLDLTEMARALGMGRRHGPGPSFRRTLERVSAFGFAQLVEPDVLVVRTHMPLLTRRQLHRFPDALQREHDDWIVEGREPPPEPLRERARVLAASLLDLGEDPAGIERHLASLRFAPDLAREAVTWATAGPPAVRELGVGGADERGWGDDAA